MLARIGSATAGFVLAVAALIALWIPIDVDVKVWGMRILFVLLLLQSTSNGVWRMCQGATGPLGTLHTFTLGVSWTATLMGFIALLAPFGTDPDAVRVFLTLALLLGVAEDFAFAGSGALPRVLESRPAERLTRRPVAEGTTDDASWRA